MFRCGLVFLLVLNTSLAALAQEDPDSPRKPSGGKSLERLQILIPPLQAAEQELTNLKAQLEGLDPSATAEKADLAAKVAAQREQVAQLRDDFLTIATGVEEARYLGQGDESASWEQNLEDIIAPISREVRQMTAGAREMENLKNQLKDAEARRDMASIATGRLKTLIDQQPSAPIGQELEKALTQWNNRLAEANSQIEVLSEQTEERERESPSTWEAVSEFFAEFWRTRGLNLLLAMLFAVLIFVVSRRSYRLIRGVSPLHRKGGQNLAARVLDLAWAGVAALLAMATAVIVLYLRGDWLLLALAILAILGMLWASKKAIPPYLEQIRLILNLGPVRQGERMVYEGIAWRVDRLHFYCEFRNPALSNAILRLPVRDVMPLHSRPAPPKEPWFPTHADDWVKLADDTYGKVIQQSPEQVVVLRLGGSLKTYPTSDFLAQCPENLSRGFRINTTFGIDYQHQERSTTEIPSILQEVLERTLVEKVASEHLRSLKVEFASAAASSLDYAVLADFDGEVASRLNSLERLIQKTCVDVCNEHGWVIPFTQITVHQAEGVPVASS